MAESAVLKCLLSISGYAGKHILQGLELQSTGECVTLSKGCVERCAGMEAQ